MRRIIFLLFLLLASISIAPEVEAAEPYCEWTANGCDHIVDVGPGGIGYLFSNCGGGWVYIGSGSVGDCPF